MNRVALCITAAIFHARNAMQPNTPPNMGIQKMSDEQTYPRVIRVEANTNLKQIGVQPGWFVRAGSCSIWFEVQHVYDKAILVATRDPRRVSDVVSVGNSSAQLTRCRAWPRLTATGSSSTVSCPTRDAPGSLARPACYAPPTIRRPPR